MASLTNTKIKNTYVSLLKVADNGQLDAALQDITDGAGNVTGVQLNTGGDLAASGTVSFGSLKDTGENITISKFVDAADGIGSNNNDTTIPTSAAVSAYVASQITLEDLDFTGDSGTGAVDLDSQTLNIVGTANEITTAAGAQTLTIGLPATINVNVTGDLTGNVTATSVLVDGVIATTQTIGDNSTKVATTAYVDAAITAEDLDIAGDSGTGAIDLDSQVLTVAGTANEVETSASGQTITVGLPSNVTIGNDLTVTTNATVGGTLGVTGATGVDGNFDVATNKFTVQAATGNTAVAGTLDATGLASLDGGIDVDGAFTVADTSGNISTSGTLGVTGTSTLGVINASGLASLDAGIDVDGVFTVADTTGNVSTTGTLAVTGITTLTDDLAVDTDTLFVDVSTDRVGINKAVPTVALDVTGDITSSATITGVTLTGTLSTAAQTNITSVGTLSSLAVSGNLTVDTDTLFVDAANNRVGVGTASPAYKMEIDGGSAETRLRISTSGTDADEAGIILANSGKVGFNDGIQIAHGAGITTFKDLAGEVQMAIDVTNSRVGIGTSSPVNTLDVVGNINVNDTSFFRYNGDTGLIGSASSIATGTSTQLGIRAANDILFATGGATERMRILSTGGLTFNGDTAAANALDDYEEGTFTFTAAPNTSGTLTLNASYNTGAYTKIGRVVTVSGLGIFSSVASPVGTYFTLAGLPFTVQNSPAARGSMTVNFADQSLSYAASSLPSYVAANTTNALIFIDTSTIAALDEFNFSLTYIV
jgi:hypothetical protein